ncbi:MAG: hypothetical protein ACE5IR_13805 [bacterium]
MPRKKKLEVGKEVVSECRKCKADTAHRITVIKDDAVRKVICNSCQHEHVFREPKGVTAVKRGPGRPKKDPSDTTTARKRRSRKKDWPSLISKVEESEIVDYDLNSDFTETIAIRHKRFGVGVITKVLAENKIEVVFEENKKVLAQNWES